jgi:hypothetical protein
MNIMTALFGRTRPAFGKIEFQNISRAELAALFLGPVHAYPGQRDHAKTAPKRKHVLGALFGDSLVFSAVYVVSEKRLMGIDGYHRANNLLTPDGAGSTLAYVPEGEKIWLKTHVVADMAEANKLFEQFNSLAAAKKSTCWFESGLREAGLLNHITSRLVTGHGKATAVQLAAGMRGPTKTKAATLAVIKGLQVIDSYGLSKTTEITGVIAVYLAIAQHCKELDAVEYFVRSINAAVYRPLKLSRAQEEVMKYRRIVMENQQKTGGGGNLEMFALGLGFFTKFAYLSKRKSVAVPAEGLTLPSFIESMTKL